MMAPSITSSIPKGSTVLVTGVNGFVGSHVVDQFLFHGFKVRGTVRDVARHAWLTKLFEKKHGIGNFELVSVPNMAANGAFDDVVKGVSAVIHTASVLTMNPDPNKMIPDSVAGAVAALKAAYSEPGVKRFVFTSSSAATAWFEHGQPAMTITEDTWNKAAVEAAWADPPYEPQRAPTVYAASKTQAEQEIWKFHRENRLKHPKLTVNTVLPSVIFGKSLDRANQGCPSSSALPVALWEGKVEPPHMVLAPQYFVNVQDVARLHVAGATLPEVGDRRIFAFAEHFSWDSILEIMRRHSPERKFIENFSGGQDTAEVTPRAYAEELLRDLGEPGWTSLQDTILEIVKGQQETEHGIEC
ncbi:Epimerase domain-containing protein [Fusarium sp. LHS14.1]|nr:Epimerase domain-containing protein [Fusarium sp. LHS14.1]